MTPLVGNAQSRHNHRQADRGARQGWRPWGFSLRGKRNSPNSQEYGHTTLSIRQSPHVPTQEDEFTVWKLCLYNAVVTTRLRLGPLAQVLTLPGSALVSANNWCL